MGAVCERLPREVSECVSTRLCSQYAGGTLGYSTAYYLHSTLVFQSIHLPLYSTSTWATTLPTIYQSLQAVLRMPAFMLQHSTIFRTYAEWSAGYNRFFSFLIWNWPLFSPDNVQDGQLVREQQTIHRIVSRMELQCVASICRMGTPDPRYLLCVFVCATVQWPPSPSFLQSRLISCLCWFEETIDCDSCEDWNIRTHLTWAELSCSRQHRTLAPLPIFVWFQGSAAFKRMRWNYIITSVELLTVPVKDNIQDGNARFQVSL